MDANGNGKRGLPILKDNTRRQRQDSDKTMAEFKIDLMAASTSGVNKCTPSGDLPEVLPKKPERFSRANRPKSAYPRKTTRINIEEEIPPIEPIPRGGIADSSDLEFTYDDTDSHANEIAELYSYTEQPELSLNVKAFEDQMELYNLPPSWQRLSLEKRGSVVMKLLDQLEVSNKALRMRAARCILYIAQGCWAEMQSDAEQQQWARINVMLLYQLGVFSAFTDLLNIEMEDRTAAYVAINKITVSLADSHDLRVILSVLYIITEVMRNEKESNCAEYQELVEAFCADIGNSNGDELLVVKLLGMVTRFCSGAAPHFPMKKVLLLLWKLLLVSLGGMKTLKALKEEKRAKLDLPPLDEDTMEIAKTMRASSPPASASDLLFLESQNQKRSSRPFRRVKSDEFEYEFSIPNSHPPKIPLLHDLMPEIIPKYPPTIRRYRRKDQPYQDPVEVIYDPKMKFHHDLPDLKEVDEVTIDDFIPCPSTSQIDPLFPPFIKETDSKTNVREAYDYEFHSKNKYLLKPREPSKEKLRPTRAQMEYELEVAANLILASLMKAKMKPLNEDDILNSPRSVSMKDVSETSSYIDSEGSCEPGPSTYYGPKTKSKIMARFIQELNTGPYEPYENFPNSVPIPLPERQPEIELENLMKQSSLDDHDSIGMELDSSIGSDTTEELNEIPDFEEQRRPPESVDNQVCNNTQTRPNSSPPLPNTNTVTMQKGLPWKPKVRQKDIDMFLDAARLKFIGYSLQGDRESLAGLPLPIHEGIKILKEHIYTSLSEIQIQREEEIHRNPLSSSETEEDIEMTPTEVLYQAMLSNLPQYMIALLKILLAAAPTSKTKTDSINIVADVLPEEMPMTVLQSMKLGIDVNRHKEIIVKAVSGILLLLLKHLKLNHIYQFEFMSQHLVFANCIPLVLKFFNQNIMGYIGAKNIIPILDFPACVIGDQPELTIESLEIGDAASFSWRNMYSCINLLRILNKLTKWKHSRIMMLVVFKSAPILKRTLKVRHAMTQLYVLKLLKMQTKYLGRQWRKSNMKTISAIYQKVRHRLNDDWAYGNDLDARPWDFQAEECALRTSVDRFNNRRYSQMTDGEFVPVDNCLNSVLGTTYDLSDSFKQHYHLWLEQEVYGTTIEWEKLLSNNKI